MNIWWSSPALSKTTVQKTTVLSNYSNTKAACTKKRFWDVNSSSKWWKTLYQLIDSKCMFQDRDTSVSYTHLDVYKRQSKNRITGTGGQPFYLWDKWISIESWGAKISNSNLTIDSDEKTDVYKRQTWY